MFLAGNTIKRPCKPSFRFMEFSTNTYLGTLRDYKTIKSIHIMLRMSLIGMAEQRQEPLIIVSILPDTDSQWQLARNISPHGIHDCCRAPSQCSHCLMRVFIPSPSCCSVAGEDYYLHPFWGKGAAHCSINMYFVLNVNACIVHFSHENESLRGIQPAWASSGSTAAEVRTTL